MNTNIEYEPLHEKYIDEAIDLVLPSYNEEKAVISFLPSEKGFNSYLREQIVNVFHNGNGIVATKNNKLIGFLAGYEVNELFGKCKGIYSPLYGHGVQKDYGDYLWRELYKRTADQWVKKSFLTHAITFYAHDKKTIDAWFWMGFGMRCVDSIRQVETIDFNNPAINIRKVDCDEIPVLLEIHREHNQYYKKSPIFMPRIEEDPIQDLTEWMVKNNHHLWAAYRGDRPVGYMRIQPSAETFVSNHPSVMNITGAYVVPVERKTGIGAMLLDIIQQWLQQQGYPLCGVDFESINITGSSFWNKYFTPYTYSMVRRIDERVIITYD